MLKVKTKVSRCPLGFESDLREINRSLDKPRYASERRIVGYFLRQIVDVNLHKGRVLEVGAGDGVFSSLLAALGFDVDALDPYLDGSDANAKEFFERISSSPSTGKRVKRLENNLEQLPDGPYDLVVLHNVVNHLDEDACRTLHYYQKSFERYSKLFDVIRSRTVPTGTLVIADCSRDNFFGMVKVRNPFAPDIEWALHQSPATWTRVLESSGFRVTSVKWNSPSRLGKFGRILLSNRVGAFFTSSHFRIVATAEAE